MAERITESEYRDSPEARQQSAQDNRYRFVGNVNLKQALYSIMIGAIISFLTVLFQGLVDFLKDMPAEIPGGIAGAVRYLYTWKSNLHV